MPAGAVRKKLSYIHGLPPPPATPALASGQLLPLQKKKKRNNVKTKVGRNIIYFILGRILGCRRDNLEQQASKSSTKEKLFFPELVSLELVSVGGTGKNIIKRIKSERLGLSSAFVCSNPLPFFRLLRR